MRRITGPLAILVFSGVALLPACGSSSDTAEPDGGKATTTTLDADGKRAQRFQRALFCAATEPLFPADLVPLTPSETDEAQTKAQATELADTYTAMAKRTTGDDADLLTGAAKALQPVVETGSGSALPSEEVKALAAPCAQRTIAVEPTATDIGDVPAEIKAGTTAFELTMPEDGFNFVVLPMEPGTDPLDAVTAPGTTGVLVAAYLPEGESTYLKTLAPGSYVIAAGPGDQTSAPTEQQVAELTVT